MSDVYKQQVEKGYVQKNTCTSMFISSVWN